jgi:hypothetical protein
VVLCNALQGKRSQDVRVLHLPTHPLRLFHRPRTALPPTSTVAWQELKKLRAVAPGMVAPVQQARSCSRLIPPPPPPPPPPSARDGLTAAGPAGVAGKGDGRGVAARALERWTGRRRPPDRTRGARSQHRRAAPPWHLRARPPASCAARRVDTSGGGARLTQRRSPSCSGCSRRPSARTPSSAWAQPRASRAAVAAASATCWTSRPTCWTTAATASR